MRIVYQHIQYCKEHGSDQRHKIGFVGMHDGVVYHTILNFRMIQQKQVESAQPFTYMPIEEKYQEKEDKGQNIAGFHPGCFHQRPGGKEAFDEM